MGNLIKSFPQPFIQFALVIALLLLCFNDTEFGTVERLKLIVPEREVIRRVLVMQSQELFQLCGCHLLVLQLPDFSLAVVDYVGAHRVTANLVVDVMRTLGDGKEGALTDVVFEPEVRIAILLRVVKRVLLRE